MHPTPRTVLLLLAGLPVALLPTVVSAALWPAAVAYGVAVLVLAVADGVLLVPPRRLHVSSEAPGTVYVGGEGTWVVRFEADRTQRPLDVEVVCDVDPELEPPPAATVTVAPGERAELRHRLRPRRRGALRIDRVWLRWRGPLGLMALTRRCPIDATVSVIPDIGAVRATAMKFFGSRTAFAGLKAERYVGAGTEFESLRKYVPGLDSRSIDWKATARHRTLVCRRFRAERNHQVVLAVDTGHLMGEPLDGVPRLDHAINRALLLAYLCLRTGDRVGMFGFDASPSFFVEPQGGLHAFARLQARTAELEYGTAETNYTLAMLELSARLRRRSMVVVFSEFVDAVTAELMLDNLDRLARRHLVVFVSLRDPAIESEERAPLHRLSDLNRAVVAAEIRLERERVFARLRHSGIQLVDAAPAEVSMELLNRYLDIKRRELV